MKHYLLLYILSIFLTTKLCAQNIKYGLSNEIHITGDDFYFIRKDSNSFFSISPKKDSDWQIINLSSDKMAVNFNAEISTLKINGKKAEGEKWIILKDKLCLLSTVTESKHSKLYLNYLNPDGSLNKESKVINEDNKIDNNYNIAQSSDRTKLLSYSLHNSFSMKKPYIMVCKMMDADLNVLWEKTLETTFFGKNGYLGGAFIDNKSNLYFSCQIKNENAQKGASEWSQKLLYYDYKKDSVKMIDLDYDDNFTLKLNRNFDKDNNLICVGICSKDEKNFKDHKPDGVYALKFDMNIGKITKQGVLKINEDSIEGSPRGYSLDYLIIRENGGIVIAAETRDEWSNQTHDVKSGTYSGHVYCTFGNILVGSFDPEMNPIWIKKISKCQTGQKNGPDIYCSYSLLVNSKDVMITHNDNAKNIEEKQENKKQECLEVNDVLFKYDNAFHTMIFSSTTFNEQGIAKTVKKDFADMMPEFTNGKDELKARARTNIYKHSIQVSNNQFIIYNWGLQKFVKFTYE